LKVVVVVPTYNERDNIGPLVDLLNEHARGVPHDVHVLVVDDNSPDGTQDVVRDLQARHPNVHLLTGTKQGLGVAYARGLDHALRALSAGIVVHMDADFSHDPADLPRLVAKLDEGYDLVIGARYVEGGGLPDDWGWKRRLISRIANFGVRYIAGISALHDCTNGYRAYRASVLSRVDLKSAPRGYAVLTYLAYQSLMAGAHVAEIPVLFSNRAEGTSKLRASDAMELAFNAWWIRYDRRDRFYRRATGGLSGVGANLAVVALLYHVVGVPPLVASAVAIETSVLYSFAWRHGWRIALRKPALDVPRDILRTHVVAVPSFALTLVTFGLLHGAGVPVVLAQAAGIVPAMLWNYFIGDRLLDVLRRMHILREIAPAFDSRDEAMRDPL
jgi:dolichol-phosphate mannosyltransferase